MAGTSALGAIRRSVPSVVFFTCCFSAIYLDYAHTQQWKKNNQLQRDLIEKAKH